MRNIRSLRLGLLGFAIAFGAGAFVSAQDGGEVAAPQSVAAPPASSGGTSLVDEKMIDLGAAYPDNPTAAGKTFRARKISLEPGAAALDLSGLPAIYYVTAGAVVERKGQAAPSERALHDAGAVAKGAPTILENRSGRPAEILLVDIVSGE